MYGNVYIYIYISISLYLYIYIHINYMYQTSVRECVCAFIFYIPFDTVDQQYVLIYPYKYTCYTLSEWWIQDFRYEGLRQSLRQV